MTKKTSYFGGPSAPNMGAKPAIHKQKIPNGYDTYDFKLVLSEKEKEEEDFRRIKTLVYNYERIGRQQLQYVQQDILKKFNLAYGIIDQSDYIKGTTEYETEITMLGDESLEFDLKFYPIIPNIVNTLTNFLGKVRIEYQAMAVNPEAQNEILEQKNEQLKSLLISKAKEIFDFQLEQQGITQETQPDIYQKQLEIFQALPKIQEYYSMDFRLEIEEWANHRLEIDKLKHNIKDLERDLMFNKLVCDRPFIHTNLLDGDYRPEVLRPEHCFYLRSPYVKDVSEGVMFGWFEYDSAVNLINKYGDKMTQEDIDKLQQFYLTTRFTQYTSEKYNTDVPDDVAIAQNYIAFRTEFRDRGNIRHRGEEYKEHLVETMQMYLQVPRKLQKLTMVGMDGQKVSTVVDETYTITIPPIYEPKKPKEEIYLLYGEHIEPFYINELWRCIKINLTRNPNPDLGNDIWVVLEKYPVQIANPRISKYGSLIPVNGGPMTNEYSPSVSIVDKCKPWQVFYNYLWNRNNQILQGELGIFLLINQNLIPSTNMDESGLVNKLVEWAMTARDTGLAPLSSELNQVGQNINGLTGGYGQKIDLTRTDEVLAKAKLAEICKQECLQVIGISPQLMAEISPNETATGIVQGIQKSINSLKHLYDEHFLMMEKSRQTMLEVSKYLAIKKGGVSETYMTNDKQRVIFQSTTENFPLYQIGVFMTSDFDDTLLLDEIRQLAVRDNTMGADALDKIAIMSADSVGEIRDELGKLQAQRMKTEQERQQQQMALEERKIQQQQQALEAQLQWEKERHYSDLETRVDVAELRALGSAQFAQGDGLNEITKLKQQQLKEDSYYQTILQKAQENQLKKEQMNLQQDSEEAVLNQEGNLERERLRVEREKIMAKLKISQNELAIAKENKP